MCNSRLLLLFSFFFFFFSFYYTTRSYTKKYICSKNTATNLHCDYWRHLHKLAAFLRTLGPLVPTRAPDRRQCFVQKNLGLQLKWRSSSGKMMQKEVAIVFKYKSLIMLVVYFWLNTKNYGKYRNMAIFKIVFSLFLAINTLCSSHFIFDLFLSFFGKISPITKKG